MKLTIISLAVVLGSAGASVLSAQTLVSFEFPATNSLVATTVASGVGASSFSLSSGTIETNAVTGSYFPNEPYVEETGWTATSQAAAKNFFVTLTAAPGHTFSITGVSFRAYATGAGPSGYGISINGGNQFTGSTLDSVLMTVNQSFSLSALTSATIRVQGWLDGSRTSSGSGVFRIDDFVVTGSVVPEPASAAVLCGAAALAWAVGLRRRGRCS